MLGKNWTLSPSNFAFLWEECKRCFYLKIVSGVRRPGGPMPKIFTIIDAQMKGRFLANNSIFGGIRTEPCEPVCHVREYERGKESNRESLLLRWSPFHLARWFKHHESNHAGVFRKPYFLFPRLRAFPQNKRIAKACIGDIF